LYMALVVGEPKLSDTFGATALRKAKKC